MRFIVLLSALVIAEAIKPTKYPENIVSTIAIILMVALFMDVVDFIGGN